MTKLVFTAVITLIFSSSTWARDIVAFHGLNQSIRSDAVVKPTDCTADLVNIEDHQFIENTIPSVEAAFKLGATIGHINLRKTADNKLAVFHDEDLRCRTDGSGNLNQTSMAYLKQLDVGYGYTPDKGVTFPTRGLGKGMMPTFEEMLSTFQNRPLAINVKSEDETTARLIEDALTKFPSLNRQNIIYIGGANETIQRYVSGIQLVATKQQHLACLNSIAVGAQVKKNCEGLLLAIPISYIKPTVQDLPGIISALHSVNAKIWVWDVNSLEDAKLLKGLQLDAVGTYRIDKTVSDLK